MNEMMIHMLIKAGFAINGRKEWWQKVEGYWYRADLVRDGFEGYPIILVARTQRKSEDIDWSEAMAFSTFIMTVKE